MKTATQDGSVVRDPRSPWAGGTRFGYRIGDLGLLTPERVAAEYLDLASIHPLPRAPRRMRGFIQLRGHPIPVLDAGPETPALQPAIASRPVLVIDGFGECYALLVNDPPRALGALSPASTGALPPGDPLGRALIDPFNEAGADRIWWQVDYHGLPAALMADD